MKDGLINQGKNETNLLKKNLSSLHVTDSQTTQTVSYGHTVSKSLIKSKTII